MRTLDFLRSLSDPVRLRIVAALCREPLHVSEICSVLQLKQSRISRHLGILAAAGVLASKRSGARVYYGLSPRFREARGLQVLLVMMGLNASRSPLSFGGDEGKSGPNESCKVIEFRQEMEPPKELQLDQQRLQVILQERERQVVEFFSQASEIPVGTEPLIDSSYYRASVMTLVAQGEPPLCALDLGCGRGLLARTLLDHAERVICVDQSPVMLSEAENYVGSERAEFRLGNLTHLPVREGEVDLVVLSMALHHAPEPLAVLSEIRRVLAPSGRLLIAELLEHTEEAMRECFADFWLGFSAEQLRDWLKGQGFELIQEHLGKGEGRLECITLLARKTGPTRQFQAAHPDAALQGGELQ